MSNKLNACPRCGYFVNNQAGSINNHSAYKVARALKKWGYISDDELESVAEMLRGFTLYK